MLPGCCPTASCPQDQILPLPIPEAPGRRRETAAGRGSRGAPRPRSLAGSLCRSTGIGTGCGVRVLPRWGCRRAKPDVYQLFEGSFYHAWKEPTSAVFGGSSGGAARRFVGGIKSLAPKLLKQGWRALCLQGLVWVLACIRLMHANSKSPCQQTQQSGRLECES